jgi:TPR repeat protein/Zn-dependent protease with chaperone function
MRYLAFIFLFLFSTLSFAEICQHIVDGDKLVSALSKRNPKEVINLDKSKNFSNFQNNHLQVFYDAKEKIQRVANLSPKFIVCGDNAPNAFAMRKDGEDVVGVTLGMVNMINGDPDMAAAVMGHEFAHHTLNHRDSMQTSYYITTFVTSIIGIALDVALSAAANGNNRGYNNNKRRNTQPIITSIGRDLSFIGGALLLSKFSRDHEREADEQSYKYMLATGFNPEGSVKLANLFTEKKMTSSGLFFDSHPGWEERGERIKIMIAKANEPESTSTQVTYTNEASSSNISAIAQNSMTGNQTQQSYSSKPFSFRSFFNFDKASDIEQKGIEAFMQKNYPIAISNLQKASNMGHHTSSIMLGNIYTNGEVVSRDFKLAYKYYKVAADHNLSAGLESLGMAYYHGRGVPRNIDKAFALVKKASEKDPNAKLNLALFYLETEQYKNHEEALKIYTEFANAGNTQAQQNLGYMHMVGQGTKVDYDEAMRYFRIVYQKDPVAGLSIAYMMELGLGMPQNIFESTKIYQELSQKGYVDAHISLGWKYFKGGEGVDKNHAEALRLFQLAERESKEYHSLRQALYGVGYVYFYSETLKNQEEGIKYMKQAAEQGDELAKQFLDIHKLS